MLPSATHDYLRKHVIEANGDYHVALKNAMNPHADSTGAPSSIDSTSIYSYFPSATSELENGRKVLSAAELEALKVRYAKQLASARLVLGDTLEEESILQAFENHHGDAKKALSELMGRSSGELHRSLKFSDALRASADRPASETINELRRSINTDVLGVNNEAEEEEFDFTSITQHSTTTGAASTDSPSNGIQNNESMTEKERERQLKRQKALEQKLAREKAKQAKEASTASNPTITSGIEAAMSSFKEEESEKRKAALNLAAWPVDVQPNVNTVVEEVKKVFVPRVVDKSQLGAEEKHDAEALMAFLSRRHTLTAAQVEATKEVKKISPDEFVVVTRQLQKLSQLYFSRRNAIIEAGINNQKQETLASAKAKNLQAGSSTDSTAESSISSGQSSHLSPGEFPPLTQAIDATAPFSMLNITEALEVARQSSSDSLAQTLLQCDQAQIDEIAQLESILSSDRCMVAECNPRVVAFSLSDPVFPNPRDPTGKPITFRSSLMLQLVLVLPPTYPEFSTPIIAIRTSSPNCPLSNFARLEQHLRDEAAALVSMPSMFAIQQSAEQWLQEDAEVRQIAESLFATVSSTPQANSAVTSNVNFTIPGAESGFFAMPSLYDGLRALFGGANAEYEFQYHRFEDILYLRNKQLQKAVTFFIKCYDTIASENPVIVEKRRENPRLEFPVLNLTGDIDISASLAHIYLNQSKVRQLLEAYAWDLQEMSAQFLDSLSSSEAYISFLTSHGIEVDLQQSSNTRQKYIEALEVEEECPICFCDFARHQGFALSCGHYACIDCYSEYVSMHASSGSATTLTCTACRVPFDPLSLCGLLSSRRWSTYCRSVVSSYVGTTALRWCPSSIPCEYIIQTSHLADTVATLPPVLIQCKCEHVYCSECKVVGSHLPMTCNEQKEWTKTFPDDMRGNKNDDEAEELTRRMLAQITRSCPRCRVHISKSGGCPHMVCMGCHHEFCWVCSADWTYQHYSCNQADVGGSISSEASAATAVPGSASLLYKLRNAGFDVGFTMLLNSLTPSTYVLDPRIEAEIDVQRIKRGLPPRSAADGEPKKVIYGQIRFHKDGSRLPTDASETLSFSDVEQFIKTAELFQLAHYITTNSIKLIILFNVKASLNVNRNSPTYSTVNRVISDLISLSDHFKQPSYNKMLVWHVQNADKRLRVSLKLLLEKLQELREEFGWLDQ